MNALSKFSRGSSSATSSQEKVQVKPIVPAVQTPAQFLNRDLAELQHFRYIYFQWQYFSYLLLIRKFIVFILWYVGIMPNYFVQMKLGLR
jgi:hypothetical protein